MTTHSQSLILETSVSAAPPPYIVYLFTYGLAPLWDANLQRTYIVHSFIPKFWRLHNFLVGITVFWHKNNLSVLPLHNGTAVERKIDSVNKENYGKCNLCKNIWMSLGKRFSWEWCNNKNTSLSSLTAFWIFSLYFSKEYSYWRWAFCNSLGFNDGQPLLLWIYI